jgi:hypothetical protein
MTQRVSAWSRMAALGALLSACTGDFAPQMHLEGYRVIGIEASPPELPSTGAANISVYDYSEPGSAAPEYEWSLCLYSLGPDAGYECLDPELEISLPSESTFVLDLSDDGFDIAERLRGRDLAGTDGLPLDLNAGFDVWLRLKSGPTCKGCQIESVKRLHLHNGDATPLNNNPIIEGLDIEGSHKTGQILRLSLRVARPEAFLDSFSGESRREEYLYSWYTSDGKTDPPRTFGNTRESELRLPETPGELEVIVAVRDGRGGLAVERQTITVE